MKAGRLGLLGMMAAALAIKPAGVVRVPPDTKTGRRMAHAKGAHETLGTAPALTPDQRNWSAQVEAKRKAKGK